MARTLANLISILLFSLTVLLPAVVHAQKIKGQDAPQFSEAVSHWLDGDDLTALQKLAALAREGNTAAQVLLASIESSGALHEHATKSLPRKERIELLRIPKGLSGTSWMNEAAKTEPLAQAILQSALPAQRAKSVGQLFDLGEPIRAMLTARSMLFQGDYQATLEALSSRAHALPDEAQLLIAWALQAQLAKTNNRYVGSARINELMFRDERMKKAELTWVSPDPSQISSDPKVRQDVLDYIDEIEAWTPIRQFCEQRCSATQSTCSVLGVGLLWSAGPFPLRSPLENIVPNDIYWNSPRIDEDIANRLPDLQKIHPSFRQLDRCFSTHMSRLQEQLK